MTLHNLVPRLANQPSIQALCKRNLGAKQNPLEDVIGKMEFVQHLAHGWYTGMIYCLQLD